MSPSLRHVTTHVSAFFLAASALACGSGGADPESGRGPDETPADPPAGSTTTGCTAPCVEADVTLTDGSTFHFAQPAAFGTDSGHRSITAVDGSRHIGVFLRIRPDGIRLGEVYASSFDGPVSLWVIREPQDAPGKSRVSNTKDGRITFTRLDPGGEGAVEGTFDDSSLVRTEPDDTVHITLKNGVIRPAAAR